MLLAFASALLPVALGVALGAAPTDRAGLGGPARTFALAAAGTMVLVELLPASAARLGLGALVVFAIGLGAPAILERLVRGLRGAGSLGTLLALGGVILHQFVDGVEIGATWADAAGLGIALSIGAHAIPLVAVVVQRFAGARGPRVGLLAFGLLGATAAGVGAGSSGVAALPGAEGWLPALVGGLLLHVMGHSMRARPPGSRGERLAEMVALAAGIGLPLALVVGHDVGPHHAGVSVLTAAARLGLQAAPALLVGLLLAAAVGWDAHRMSPPSHRAGWVAAAVFGVPALGLDALLLSVGFLGPGLAAARLGLAVAAAGAGGWALARVARPADSTGGTATATPTGWAALDAALMRVGPWMAASLVLAGLVQQSVAPSQLAAAADLHLDWLAAAAVGPVWIEPAAAMPVMGALLNQGLSPAVGLVVLVCGPGLSLPALALLAARYGPRAAGVGGAAFVGVSLVGASLWGRVAESLPPLPQPAVGTSPVAWLCAGALLLLAVRSLWVAGPRAWAAGLASAHDPAAAPRG